MLKYRLQECEDEADMLDLVKNLLHHPVALDNITVYEAVRKELKIVMEG
jgi:hypothetical protein